MYLLRPWNSGHSRVRYLWKNKIVWCRDKRPACREISDFRNPGIIYILWIRESAGSIRILLFCGDIRIFLYFEMILQCKNEIKFCHTFCHKLCIISGKGIITVNPVSNIQLNHRQKMKFQTAGRRKISACKTAYKPTKTDSAGCPLCDYATASPHRCPADRIRWFLLPGPGGEIFYFTGYGT